MKHSAYTQVAICAATRASFLTGTRPDTTRIWNIGPYFRDTMINGTGKTVKTLPQYFKDFAKYYTVGAGKVFHPGSASGGTGKCNLGDDMPLNVAEFSGTFLVSSKGENFIICRASK